MIGKICGLRKYVEVPPEPTYRTMTAIIDLTNSNPATCITYADDAVDMEAKSEAWDDFFGHYPCLFKEGQEVGKLNRNNFAQFEDGSSADITSGNSGDVMIAFPRRGLKIETSADGNTVTVSMTDNPDDENFKYYAHSREETRKDIFYLGAYKGYVISNKLRSLSGKFPSVNQTINTFRIRAQANGIGYEQSGFYQLIYRQAMYILKYKNLNSSEALGLGYVNGNISSISTGNTNAKGMNFGEVAGKQQMKLFGIEDFWGNINEKIDGVLYNSSMEILTATDVFNNNGTGYINQGKGATATLNGYMSKPQGNAETGFIPKEASGAETTYFCDYTALLGDSTPVFGGVYNHGAGTGIFYLHINRYATHASNEDGARLMYL